MCDVRPAGHSAGRGCGLQLAHRAAPIGRIHIGNGLRKAPAMTGRIFHHVLPFSIWIVSRRLHHASAALAGTRIMAVRIFHPNHHGASRRNARLALFGNHNRTVSDIQLSPMIADSQPQREPEGPAKPLGSLSHIRIRKFRDHRAPGDQAVGNHTLEYSGESTGGISSAIGRTVDPVAGCYRSRAFGFWQAYNQTCLST